MSVMQILKEYSGLETAIKLEVANIQRGCLNGGLMMRMIREVSGNEEAEKARKQFREREWYHLLEYRRLMERKYFCEKALNRLSEKYRLILLDRETEMLSWCEIAEKYHYSESQVKRLHKRAVDEFAAAYRDVMTGE